MLEIAVDPARGHSVLSRRAFLRTSLVAGLGGLASPLRAARTRRDTAVIQVWLGGGPSHIDMYDLKPRAVEEYRGPYRPVATNVPGTQVCELMPRQTRLMDRLALVRSLRHTTSDHAPAMHWLLTGYFAPVQDQSTEPTHPSVGSVVARLRGANRPGMVPYAHVGPNPLDIPFFLRLHEGAYLGARYAPLRVESARAGKDPSNLESLISKVHFELPALQLLPGLDVARLESRAELGRHLDGLRRRLDRPGAFGRLEEFQEQALQLMSSDAARQAFDLSQEDPRLRDRYGRNTWGQGLLLCRRLVEAGVTFVTLNTDAYSGIWDTHAKLKQESDKMLPAYDQMLAALLDDLISRGLYERVLVLVWGEFGRTPKMNNQAGRDHWGPAGFALLGGAGVKGGVVVGSTTARGEEPKERPVGPEDILATVYHVLGIDPDTEFPDRAGRPIKVLSTGAPVRELLR